MPPSTNPCRKPYRITIRLVTFADGQRAALMALSTGHEDHVRIYCDLETTGRGETGQLWGRVTLWNPCWSHGNQGCAIDSVYCRAIVQEALGSLSFARKAQPQQVAA